VVNFLSDSDKLTLHHQLSVTYRISFNLWNYGTWRYRSLL